MNAPDTISFSTQNLQTLRLAEPGCQFASDNTSGICPEAWDALTEANSDAAASYGNDAWTQAACERLRDLFEKPDAEVFFVFNGTAANALALASCSQSYHSVICHEQAHIETDECGAPEFFSNGTKLLLASGADGKLQPASVEALITKRSDIHYPKPRVLSITQSTECGTIYTVAELRALTAIAQRHGLITHMDGARFANAYASLRQHGGLTPADLTWKSGIDVLCFGGTKNGMNTSEAVIFFNPELAHEFEYRCKQAGQLASKMRFLSSQWVGMLRGDAWLHHAAHANDMATRLAERLNAIPGVHCRMPQANAVFMTLPEHAASAMRQRGWDFYAFIGRQGCRLMCSWNTRNEDITQFVEDLKASLRR